MGFNCGIVGLPNVGKSSLFNAMTSAQAAEAANYPFCTIEPNRAKIGVPDSRLQALAALANSEKIIETQVDFVDIAGLVRGASKGEGLGNQFLSHIREVDAICHVLRCFEDDDITHVNGVVNPYDDAETVNTELLLADMQSLENRVSGLVKKSRSNDKEAQAELALVEKCLEHLQAGKAARFIEIDKDDAKAFRMLNLLTAKPMLYISNVEEGATGNANSEKVAELAKQEGAEHTVISAAIEAEIALLPSQEEKDEFLGSLGLEESGLNRIISAAYRLLGRISFFTCGPKETRAWSIRNGATAYDAAGEIHTDFQRGFIGAETVSYDDYLATGGEQQARDAGKSRVEGRDYVVKDGDVIHFRFNV